MSNNKPNMYRLELFIKENTLTFMVLIKSMENMVTREMSFHLQQVKLNLI